MANAPLVLDIELDAPDLMPTKAHEEDAGLDLVADADVALSPLERVKVPAGLKIDIPKGHVGYVMSRSGLSYTKGICVLNSPGVIDSGYTGKIFISMINMSPVPYQILRGDRIAQLIVQKIENVQLRRVFKISSENSSRGANGYGSSGAN